MAMKSSNFETPVVLIIFNRPDHTRKVFEKISRIKPRNFFIISDGPRPEKKESDLVDMSRSIVNEIDWACNLYTNFSDVNLGCKYRPATGIDWVFEHVDRAIILEDDCLPDLSFFYFCDELLTKYENVLNVGMISGCNLLEGSFTGDDDYFFTWHSYTWGWATWKNRWSDFDLELESWSEVKESNFLEDIIPSKEAKKSWINGFDNLKKGGMDAWDYQWLYTNWIKRRINIVPKKNLISNIGFDSAATHTFNSSDRFSNVPSQSIQFPLKHPEAIEINYSADFKLYNHVFGIRLIHRLQAFDRSLRDFIKKLPGGWMALYIYRKLKK